MQRVANSEAGGFFFSSCFPDTCPTIIQVRIRRVINTIYYGATGVYEATVVGTR